MILTDPDVWTGVLQLDKAGGGPDTHGNKRLGARAQPTSWANCIKHGAMRAGGQRFLGLALSTHRAAKHPWYLWQAVFVEKVPWRLSWNSGPRIWGQQPAGRINHTKSQVSRRQPWRGLFLSGRLDITWCSFTACCTETPSRRTTYTGSWSFPQGHLDVLYNGEGIFKMVTVTFYVAYVHIDCHRFLTGLISIWTGRDLLREAGSWLPQAHHLARDGNSDLVLLQKFPPPRTETTGG